MEAGNRLCVECCARDAVLFCTCTQPEVFLCEECSPNHSKKRTRSGHPTWPISDLLTYKDPGYFNRQEAFPKVQDQARQGVADVEKAILEYKSVVDKLIADILAIAEATVSDLVEVQAKLSKDVSASLEEVEGTLANTHPKLRSKYGPVLRALVEKPVTFQFFVFDSPTCAVPPQTLISFKSNLRLPKELLAEVQGEPRLTPAVPKVQLPPTFFDVKKETAKAVEAHYLESIKICATHFPQSKEFAKCYHNLGCLYKDLQMPEQAEAQLKQAIQLYEVGFSQDLSYAKCLVTLGLFYWEMKKFRVSETHYLQALSILSSNYPETLDYANCLTNLGALYYDVTQYEQAETQLLQACQLYQCRYSGDINFASNLRNLGLLYEATGRTKHAAEKLKAAIRIYEQNGDGVRGERCREALRQLAK